MSSLHRAEKRAPDSDQTWETIWKDEDAIAWIRVAGNAVLGREHGEPCLLFKEGGSYVVQIIGQGVSLDMRSKRVGGCNLRLLKATESDEARYVVDFVPGEPRRNRLVTFYPLASDYTAKEGDEIRKVAGGIFATRPFKDQI